MAETPPPPTPNTGPHTMGAFLPRQSVGLKLILVCALALVMIIPALLVYGVVNERSTGLDMAIRDISQSVGGQQAVLGPVLGVPYAHAPDPNKPDKLVYGVGIAYAETGQASADVAVTERQRSIHMIPIFDADIGFEAEFDTAAIRAAVPEGGEPIWADIRLYMGVSDTRGIKDAMSVIASPMGQDPQRLTMEPATRVNYGEGYDPVPQAGVTLAAGAIKGLQSLERPLKVTADLRLSGAERLAIGPFAKNTDIALTSNWGSPSFVGGILPDQHDAGQSEAGFSARWTVPYLARGIAGAGPRLDLGQVTARDYRDMGVRFLKDVSPYQSVERALKYAAMFVGFVFLAYFLFEVTSGARAHPAQYVLVGLAQTIFYLLLLAFAERIGFDLAFAIAALMTVGLTSTYAASVFGSKSYGLRACGILSGIYVLNYILMRAEDQALVAGALASFAAIGLTMYMTRNVDWYGDRKPVTDP